MDFGDFSLQPNYEKEELDYAAMHPLKQAIISHESEESKAYFERFSYVDFLPVKKNGDKTLTVSYDITDLEDYEIIALDRAFNMNTLSAEPLSEKRGDVNCDGAVDIADVVMLTRLLAEDEDVTVTAQGKRNADCNRNGQPDGDDSAMILQDIAKLIRL